MYVTFFLEVNSVSHTDRAHCCYGLFFKKMEQASDVRLAVFNKRIETNNEPNWGSE